MEKIKLVKMKRYLDCDFCQELLVDPVEIPCDNIICKRHVDDSLNRKAKQKNMFECVLCKEDHRIPRNGFEVNKRLKVTLSMLSFWHLALLQIFKMT